ncbi:hypothetical protein [Cellulomonas sp. ATA003]|uniref:hypothetical protein n=1 Tax=Cellulomonas sp. ATA003 TaxID=3073064 RepID=UPI0028730162|nr:hypothetical protein [Cellulomonas sp. ATA003]WNB86554.1 hypothetical protein REH70_04795 [Cellulomonas sp. ATA003]
MAWALGSRAAHPFPLGAFAGLVDVPAGDAAGAVTRALDALVRRGRLVLAVDDAHLLDDLSAVVLHRVVVRGIAPVLVTVRDRETAPDLVTALWREDLLPGSTSRRSTPRRRRRSSPRCCRGRSSPRPPTDCGGCPAAARCSCGTWSPRRSPQVG